MLWADVLLSGSAVPHRQSRVSVIPKDWRVLEWYVQTGFNLKSLAASALIRQPTCLGNFKAGHWLFLSSYESPTWHLQHKAFQSTLKKCWLWIFWKLYCNFYMSTCCFTLHFNVMEVASFLKLVNQSLLVLDFSSAASSLLSAFIELKRVRTLTGIRLWLKGILWLVWYSFQTTTTFFLSAIGLFCFLIVHVFTGVAF